MKIIRKTVSFPEDLAEQISTRAKLGNRSFSGQVVHELLMITKILVNEKVSIGYQESRIEEEE